MKKLCYFFLITVVAVSCSQLNDENSLISVESDGYGSCVRSVDEAIQIAQKAAEYFFEYNTKSDTGLTRSVDNWNICCYPPVDTKSTDNSSLMYVVNFEDNNGFVLVGRNRNAPEVIAVVENGTYNGEKTDNPGFEMYMEDISKQLMMLSTYSVPDYEDIMLWQYKDEITEDINAVNGPLISAKWGQYAPFNEYCPNSYPTGCVATAVALAMSAHKYPSSINLTFSGAPAGQVSLSWENMIQSEHDCYHNPSCSYCNQNALLQREIGHRMRMDYGADGSGTSTKRYAIKCLESFGYECGAYIPYDISEIFSSVEKKYPVIIRAENAEEGHAWVVDGTQYQSKRIDTYRNNSRRIFVRWEHCNYNITRSKYLHMNYGWGEDDTIGYYLAEYYIHAEGIFTENGYMDQYPIRMFTGEDGFDKDVFIIPNIHVK